MEKVGRKPSSDPAQEKIRQNKAQWNKEVSTFINDLINFKKMMNGWPSKFHMERSSIKEPIPADPSTIIGVLAGDFQELAQKSNTIVSQQLEYSKSRKKSQPKVKPAPNLSQQLSLPQVAEADYELVAEGSNPITRFVSTLKGPWFGSNPATRARKYRVAMLKSAADTNNAFKKFEDHIMGSSPESIFSSSKILSKIENQIYYLLDSLASQKILINKSPDVEKKKEEVEETSLTEKDSTVLPSEDEKIIVTVKDAISDFRRAQPNFNNLNHNLERELSSFIIKFFNAPTNADKAKIAPALLQAYNNLLNDANMKNNTNASTLSDVLMSKLASFKLEVLAQSFLTKWLGQIKHKLSPFDKTSALRLDLLSISKDSRKIMDIIMDSLEKDIDYKLLESNLNLLSKNIENMKQIMKPLENIIRGNMFDKTFLDLLKNKNITEYGFGLDTKQQDRLERMIQQRQYRDLTNLYSRR